MIEETFPVLTLRELNLSGWKPRSFYYLASPYARYIDGRKKAFEEVVGYASILIQMGVTVHSPIAHNHPISEQCDLSQTDHDFWMAVDLPMVRASSGVLIAPMAGWRLSKGIASEIAEAKAYNISVHILDAHY